MSPIKEKFANQRERDNQAWDIFYQNLAAEARRRTAGELGSDVYVNYAVLHAWFLSNKRIIKDRQRLVAAAIKKLNIGGDIDPLKPFYENDDDDADHYDDEEYDDDR